MPIAKIPYYFLVVVLCYLPLQVALSPVEGIDLASGRILIILLFFVWIGVALLQRNVWLPWSFGGFLLGSAVFLIIVSIFWAANPVWGLRKAAFILSFLPIFFVCIGVVRTRGQVFGAVRALAYGATAAAVLALGQFSLQFVLPIGTVVSFWAQTIAPIFLGQTFAATVESFPSWLVEIGGTTLVRAYGSFPDPHMLAFFMGMVFPLALYLVYAHKNNPLMVFCAVCIGFADVLSFSRGGYIGLVAAIFVAAIILVPRLGVYARAIAVAVFLSGMLLVVVPGTPVSERFYASFDATEGSNQGRIETWYQAADVISSAPLLGVGLGSYAVTVKPTAEYREPIYAHSLYLDIWAESGMFALLFWIVGMGFVIVRLLRSQTTLSLALASSVILFSVHALVETPLYSVRVFPLLLVLIALSLIILRTGQAGALHRFAAPRAGRIMSEK